LIEEEWKRRKKFDFDPPCKKRGIRVMRIEVNEKHRRVFSKTTFSS